MIEVDGLTKFYGQKAAIEEVSFEVAKGEVVGFLGPNGAGKTTTMRILACFMPPTSGTARLAGLDIGKQSLEVRRRIGYLPESVPLYGDMTVRQYLTFAAEAKGVPRPERSGRVAGVMERCLIADVQERLIRNLSKGYRQRVGLAQALVGDPEVLILDEPTLGLDPKQIIEIRSLIRDMRGERTVILSTHILPEVSMVCQRVIIINDGRIVAVDTPENLNLRLQKSSRILLEVEGPAEDVRRTLAGVKGVLAVTPQEARDGRRRFLVETDREQDLRKDLARAVANSGWGLTELRPVDLTLEDIFIRLVTREEEA
ncbi:MAG: ABC transporter ATP-binding protein [candidate division NC10 bacterium]|nr:ABC transporter ATP-binding protein [candidate division NC10 bacterium]